MRQDINLPSLDKIYEEQQSMNEAPRGLNGAEEAPEIKGATTEENEESKGAAQKVLE